MEACYVRWGPSLQLQAGNREDSRSSDDEVVRTVSLMWGVDMQVTEGGSSGSPIFDSQVSIFHDQSRSSD